jgi:uracil-DNA glycosylase
MESEPANPQIDRYSLMTPVIEELIELSGVHEEWCDVLSDALAQVDGTHLQRLLERDDWLPGKYHLLAAFRRDLTHCRYILFGESPYPRQESANGIAFYDAAVDELWSNTGLSKAVNRATSLRNIIKSALLAEGRLQTDSDGRITQSIIAEVDKRDMIRSIGELFANLQQTGFLMFNATPVLIPDMKVSSESRYWQPFLQKLLQGINENTGQAPALILWGNIANRIEAMPTASDFPIIKAEHPYNISFIHNPQVLELFAQIKVLRKSHVDATQPIS